MATLRAAIYLRVSTEEQADPDEHHSLPAQERACRALCRSRGWQVAQVYKDEGASASKRSIAKRPYFRAMLDDAETRPKIFDVIVVHKVDRFARNIQAALEALARLNAAEVLFVSATETIDFTTPAGRLLLNNILAVSQFFSENLADEARKGWNERGEKGYWRGDPPFGYCRGQCPQCKEPNGPKCPRYQGEEPLGPERELYTHPWEGPGLKLAFEVWLRDETHSYREVAQALNAAGYRTHRKAKRGGPTLFPIDAPRGLLKNAFYLGLIRVRDRSQSGKHYVTAPGKHDALIDAETFQAAQKKIQTVFASRRPECHTKRPYPLSHVGRCALCGAPLQGQTDSHGIRRYICSRRAEHGADPAQGGCPLPGLRADEAEAKVMALLDRMQIAEEDKEQVLATLDSRPAENTAAEIEKIRRGLEELTWLLQEQDIDRDEYRRRKAGLQAQLERLRPPAKGEILRAVDLLATIGIAYRQATSDTTRTQLLQAMFEGIYLDEPARDPQVKNVRPQSAFLAYWSLLVRTSGAEGIRTPDLSLDRAAC